MQFLPKPNLEFEVVFDTCIPLYRKKSTRDKLMFSKETILGEIETYDLLATEGDLHKIEIYDGIEDGADGDDLRGLYTRMHDENRAGRKIYNEIRASPKNDTCPYCGQRKVESIDHYLPQADFPIFCVSPTNLVPSCDKCNKIKSNNGPISPSKQYIHPYFDLLPPGIFLHVEVLHTSPASFRFFIDPPSNWPQVLRLKVLYHFEMLKLGWLYSSHAASRLSQIRGALRRNFDRNKEGAKKWLEDSAASANEADENTWEYAFYSACAESDWFCEGGFLNE